MMYEFSQPLADALKRERGKRKLSQDQVAELACIETANITKMETPSRNANPELATLYPVVRALNIDPQEFFYPGLKLDNPRIRVLQQLISDCTDEEADSLIPIVRELIRFMRNKNNLKIRE